MAVPTPPTPLPTPSLLSRIKLFLREYNTTLTAILGPVLTAAVYFFGAQSPVVVAIGYLATLVGVHVTSKP